MIMTTIMDNKSINKTQHLVCDSGPFIVGTQIQDFGLNIYTLPEVVSEIKDENTRQRLQLIPYEIKYREPSDEDIKFVVNFAKKTGDFCQLSATDIKVIALTIRLEKEINGNQNIRSEPQMNKVIKKSGHELSQPLPGFAFANKNNDKYSNENKEISENVGKKLDEHKEEEEYDSEEDSEEGWITLNNVEDIRKQMIGIRMDDEVEECVSVGCLTGDYAMQNVLLQMGLKVISIKDGLLIRQTKQFVLRCFACFKITTKQSNEFCSSCGNMRTLKRVALTVKDDGTKEVFINFKKPINIRGTRYSLPMPRGGKHTNNPILVEDQPIPQQRKSKFAIQEKRDVNCESILKDPDYVNRLNPFAINDVYSRGSRINANVHRLRNPNETRKSTGNRKKKSNKY
ncbi:RNA-binding protein NOB1-like [Oppia nitens]|uniref:RNA-binding protein NOB1-like n=1 Tax=Oppia nitens TaxID=1686743 RepID=UPI0023DBEEEE|nr:RNA-binding protein NOB1-like [Oppia nitens]